MYELTRMSLETDMDLILAYKQGMKLAELAGMTIARQTSFATAVSEVCRDLGLDAKKHGQLRLGVNFRRDKPRNIFAIISYPNARCKSDGCQYAKRLVDDLRVDEQPNNAEISLFINLPENISVNEKVLEKWGVIMNNDPAVTPYEEIKRKNKELNLLAERLRHSEQQYKSLTDSLPLMIFTMTEDGDVTYANKWMLDYMGRNMADLNAAKWKGVIHPDDFDNAWAEWAYGVAAVVPRNTERRLRSAGTGEYKWHSGVTIPVTNEKGDVVAYNAFLVDIDAQKQIEQALKDNRELKETQQALEEKVTELNQSNEELAQFAYVASHDLQEPLRKISFYSDYLKTKFGAHLPEDARSLVDNIATASGRMKQLIHDVLVYSTISEERGFVDVDLDEVVREAIQDNEFTIKEKNAEIHTSELPHVEGVPVQLRQLFENLLSNALKFTDPSRRPSISITGAVKDGMAEVKFADNGIGFEEQYVGKMFDLFQRLNAREKYDGTGIGLGICKKIVMLHNGTINAIGVPGEGATFIVRLPLKQ